MDAPYARTLAVGVAWNWFCTVYGRGTFAHVTFTLLSIFSVGIPLAIFGFIFDSCYKRKGPQAKFFFFVLWRVVFLIFLQVVHLECGQYLLQRDLANAQVYCDSFVAPLDQYKAEAGAYPARLSALPFYAEQLKAEANKTLDVPWLLKEAVKETPNGDDVQFYSVASDGQSFTFHFADPSAIDGQQYVYDSTSAKWNLVNATSTATTAPTATNKKKTTDASSSS